MQTFLIEPYKPTHTPAMDGGVNGSRFTQCIMQKQLPSEKKPSQLDLPLKQMTQAD